MEWTNKKLCDLTLEDVLQAHKEGYCFPVYDGRYIQFLREEKGCGK